MKFFNWVHKRFNHHPLPKDDHKIGQTLDNDERRSSVDQEIVMKMKGNDKETQALLKKAAFVDALDGWKDGILAIGTFGFDPLKSFNNDYIVLENDDDGDEDDKVTPDFSVEGSETEDETSDDDNDSFTDEEENPLMFSSSPLGGDHLDNVMTCHHRHEVVSDDDDDDEYKKKLGRTTLADLFLADGDTKKKILRDDDIKYNNKKLNLLNTKKGLSFAKKLIPKVKEDTSPIKNIQRLMRRMLKRKIHPELLDVKNQKSDGRIMVGGAIELVSNVDQIKTASESVSLLVMPGITYEV